MANSSMQHSTDIYNPNYITDKFFYVKTFLNVLFCNSIIFDGLVEKFTDTSFVSYLIMLILLLGGVLKLADIRNKLDYYRNNNLTVPFRNKNSNKIFLLVSFVLFALFILGFKFNYLISIVSFWIFLLILMSFAKEYPINQNNFAFFLVCIGFIVFYMTIFSFNYLKCVRYIQPMFPAFVYLVICSLEIILNHINEKKGNEKSSVKHQNSNFKFSFSTIIPLVLIVIFLFSAFNFINTVDLDNEAADLEAVYTFLLDYDSNIQYKDIAANTGYKTFEWYLNNVVDFLEVSDDSSDYDYVIEPGELENNNYRQIFSSGDYHVYELK